MLRTGPVTQAANPSLLLPAARCRRRTESKNTFEYVWCAPATHLSGHPIVRDRIQIRRKNCAATPTNFHRPETALSLHRVHISNEHEIYYSSIEQRTCHSSTKTYSVIHSDSGICGVASERSLAMTSVRALATARG